MDEKAFKTHFIATFLAAWVASNYEESCIRGQHERLNHPPAEDAEFLANKAWEELKRCGVTL